MEHEDNIHRCNFCGYHTKFVHFILKHLCEVHRKNPKTDSYCFEDLELHQCSKCTFVTHMKVNLKNHIDLTHNNLEIDHNLPQLHGVYTCGKCNLKTNSILVLTGHSCKKPKGIYGKKGLFDLEMEQFRSDCVLEEKKMFKCEQCTFRTNWNNSLRRHVLWKHASPDKIEWYGCGQCPYTSKSKSSVDRHLRTVHCQVEKIDSRYYYLTDHNGEKIRWYQCKQCLFKTKWNHTLQNHVVSKHTPLDKIKWHECDQCDYKSKFKQGLKRHMRKHVPSEEVEWSKNKTTDEDVKWFLCERCESKTTTNLKQHVQMHIKLGHQVASREAGENA